MRSFWAIARAGFLCLWSEPMPVAILTVFPIVLIFVLGNALSSLVSNDDMIEAVECAYVSDAPDSELYRFLAGDEMARYLSLTLCSSEEALELLRGREVDCVIEESGREVALSERAGSSSARVAVNIVEAYRSAGAAAGIAAMDGRNPLEYISAPVDIADAPVGGRVPAAMDYYAITMLVMILLYTGMNGMSLFAMNMTGEFGMRLRAAPVGRGTAVAGTVAASTAVSFTQGMITFLFSWAVYGVYWGERLPLVLLTLFAMTLFSQILCIFVLLLVKTESASMGLLQIFFWLSTFVSKGYVKVDFGEAAERVFRFAPNALAHTVIFGAIYGGEEAVMSQSLLILLGITAALSAGAYLLGRRRLA